MVTTPLPLAIAWEPLPPDYPLPDDPVDNLTQPLLATALTESLAQANRLNPTSLVVQNYALCATVNGKIVVKAPDWALIPHITVPRTLVERSYTPQLQGDRPLIVMEFLSETEEGEYSSKRTHPLGKWFFYEQVLQVPYYVIFEPDSGSLEVHTLDATGRYALEQPNAQQRYWLPELDLALGVWQGERDQREGDWLRWWDESGNLLSWRTELLAQEQAEKVAALAELATLKQQLSDR